MAKYLSAARRRSKAVAAAEKPAKYLGASFAGGCEHCITKCGVILVLGAEVTSRAHRARALSSRGDNARAC